MIVKTYDSLEGTKPETVLGGGRAVTRCFLLRVQERSGARNDLNCREWLGERRKLSHREVA